MAFLDKVKELAVSAAQTTSDKIEVAKVSLDIRNEETKARSVLEEIGKKIYAKYEAGIVKDEEVLQLCGEIDVIMQEIDDLKAKSMSLRDKKACVKCGKELEENDIFCAGCGTKQPEEQSSSQEDVKDATNADAEPTAEPNAEQAAAEQEETAEAN